MTVLAPVAGAGSPVTGAGLLLLRRLAGRIALCLTATCVAYVLASLTFDPLAELRGHQPRPPQEVIEARAERLGLDQPVPMRLLQWLGGVLAGDLGSTVGGAPVVEEVWRRAGTSLRLFAAGSLLGVLLGVVVGVRGAQRPGRVRDQVSLLWTVTLLAVPVFVLGTLLKVVWLPVNEALGAQVLHFTGETTAGAQLDGFAALVDRLQHAVLPTLAIALPQAAFYARYQRAAMLDVLGSEFLRAARAKGLSSRAAVRRHALRPALVPMTSLFAFTVGLHMAGGVFTERIFGWYGMGDWLLVGIHDQDANVVATVTLFLAVVVVAAGWLADVVLVALDPRVRGGHR